MVDHDRLTPVNDADRLEADRTARPGLDRPEGRLDRLLGQTPVVGLPNLVDRDAETVGDVADLALELTGDGTGQHDPRLEVEWLTESERVDHDLLDAVVVVEGDLVAVDLAHRPRCGREDDRQLVAQKSGLDAGRVDRSPTGAGRCFQPLTMGGHVGERVDERRRGGRDDVDPGREKALVVGHGARVTLGTTRAVDHAVRAQRDQGIDVVGGLDPDRHAVGQLTRVLADLVLGVDPDAHELEVGTLVRGDDGERPDPAGGPDDDPPHISGRSFTHGFSLDQAGQSSMAASYGS